MYDKSYVATTHISTGGVQDQDTLIEHPPELSYRPIDL